MLFRSLSVCWTGVSALAAVLLLLGPPAWAGEVFIEGALDLYPDDIQDPWPDADTLRLTIEFADGEGSVKLISLESERACEHPYHDTDCSNSVIEFLGPWIFEKGEGVRPRHLSVEVDWQRVDIALTQGAFRAGDRFSLLLKTWDDSEGDPDLLIRAVLDDERRTSALVETTNEPGVVAATLEIGDTPAMVESVKLQRFNEPGGPWSVAMDDQRVILGYPDTDEAWIWRRESEDVWSHDATLTLGPDDEDRFWFGNAVAIDGETAVVGGGSNAEGGAFVYRMVHSGDWSRTQMIPPARGDGRQFGGIVAMDQETVVIGDGARGTLSIFRADANGRFVRVKRLMDLVNLDTRSVSMGAGVLAVGHLSQITGIWTSGVVRTFVENRPGRWRPHQWVTALVPEERAFFGRTTGLSGETLLISERGGLVHSFTRSADGFWHQEQVIETEKSVGALAVDANIAVLSVSSNDSGLGTGAAAVYTRDNTGTWVEAAKLYGSDVGPGSELGPALAMSGTTVVIAGDSGAYVYELAELGLRLAVAIDVSPHNPRTVIDPSSPALIPVAVLSDDRFDALQLDLASIRLQPGDARARNYRVYDVDRDGMADLVPVFRAADLMIGCGQTNLELGATTHAGEAVYGRDEVTHARCR